MKNYFILSLTHSPWGNYAVWWGPNSSGYFSHLDSAGVYSEEEVKSNPGYYSNGTSTLAIPCESAERLAEKVVDWHEAHKFAEMEAK